MFMRVCSRRQCDGCVTSLQADSWQLFGSGSFMHREHEGRALII